MRICSAVHNYNCLKSIMLIMDIIQIIYLFKYPDVYQNEI